MNLTETTDFLLRCRAAKCTSTAQVIALCHLFSIVDCTMTELSVMLGVSTAAVTGIMDALEGRADGSRPGLPALAERHRHEDRREVRAVITVAGAALFEVRS